MRCFRQGWGQMLLGCMLVCAVTGEGLAQTSDAYVLLGDSTERQAIESLEVLLQPIMTRKSAPVINALAASTDGKLLAAAGDDHAIRLINPETGTVERTLLGHRDWIQALTFAANSTTLYSAANDGKVLRWRPDRNDFETVVALPFALRTISVSTAKQLLAIGGFHDEVLVWDLNSERWVRRLQCRSKDQRCVRFSPDGTQILSGGRDGDLHVWETETGRLIGHYHEHAGRVYTAGFNVDGTVVTSAGEDRKLVQYNLETKQVTLRRELAHTKLKSMCMINSHVVAVAGADNSIHLYDVLADKVMAHLEAHEGTVAVMEPCGESLVSGSFDTSIRIWNLASLKPTSVETAKPVSLAPFKMDAALRVK